MPLHPPPTIDNANVIAYVLLNRENHHDSGSIRLIADGEVQAWFHGLAIAQYDAGNGGTYLFYCDGQWETENDTLHDSIQEAIETAERKFGVRADEWQFPKLHD